MKTLKEFAYLHLRTNGCTPRQAIQYVRIAITASAYSQDDNAFELAFYSVCCTLCISNAFESLLSTISHYTINPASPRPFATLNV
jgi:hypothetical protein